MPKSSKAARNLARSPTPSSRVRRTRSGARPDAPAASLRELSKLRTRQGLIEAALLCFSEQGLDAPSLDAICARAGCTRGAFYVHFGDRDALIAAAMAERRNAVVSAFLSASPGAVSILDVLELFASAVQSGAFPPPGSVRAPELLAACRRSSVIRNAQLKLMAQLREQIARYISADQAKGRLRRDVPADDLALLVLVLEAGVELLLDLGYELDARRGVQALRTIIAAKAAPRAR